MLEHEPLFECGPPLEPEQPVEAEHLFEDEPNERDNSAPNETAGTEPDGEHAQTGGKVCEFGGKTFTTRGNLK